MYYLQQKKHITDRLLRAKEVEQVLPPRKVGGYCHSSGAAPVTLGTAGWLPRVAAGPNMDRRRAMGAPGGSGVVVFTPKDHLWRQIWVQVEFLVITAL